MIFPEQKKIDYPFWNFAFIVVSTVLFLPVFLNVFIAHTDGLIIMAQKGKWLGDVEAGIMFMQGRPLGALTDSFLGWFIYKTEDLTWVRGAVFGLTLISSRLVYLIARRENVEVLWSYWLAFIFILLPSNILHVIWVANGVPESLGSIFGTVSYFFLYHSKPKFFILRWLLAGLCFLIGLLMYQPMAMMVFALIAVKLFWSNADTWPLVRIQILREIFFYGFLMVIYWLLLKLVVLPLGHHLGLVPTTFGMYKMELATSSITNKAPLVLQTLKYGFLGGWDTLLHGHPLLEERLMFICLAAGCGLRFLLNGRGSFHVPLFSRFFQKILFIAVLFFCANAPSFMAVNCKEVIGYRTLLPASFMGLLTTCYFFRFCQSAFKEGLVKFFIGRLIIIYSFASLMMGAWTINQNVFNDLKVYSYVHTLASRIDYSHIEKVYLRYGTLIWISYSLPFEMGYLPVGLNFIFDHYASLEGRRVKVNEIYTDQPVFFDKHTEVIDYEFLTDKKIPDGNKICLIPVSGDSQQVFLGDYADQLMRFPTLKFQQELAGNKIVPDWTTSPFIPEALIYLHFIGPRESLNAYNLNADCRNARGQASFFALKWQGLDEYKRWVDITGFASCLGKTNVAQVVNSAAFSFLRLVFIKRMPGDVLTIKDLQLINH